MTIQIRDAELEASCKNNLRRQAPAASEELLLRLLESQEEQDCWLLENRGEVEARIQRGLSQLDRGEGIPEDQLKAISQS